MLHIQIHLGQSPGELFAVTTKYDTPAIVKLNTLCRHAHPHANTCIKENNLTLALITITLALAVMNVQTHRTIYYDPLRQSLDMSVQIMSEHSIFIGYKTTANRKYCYVCKKINNTCILLHTYQ